MSAAARFRVLVVDDEPLARRMLRRLLQDDADIESVSECAEAATASRTIARTRPDIVFLDIEMPRISGLDLAREFGEHRPVVVFVTAFDRYAAQAFAVDASDYVIKPFSDRRFADAVQRAKRRVRERLLGVLAAQVASVSSELRCEEPPTATSGEPLTRLVVRSGERSLTVRLSEVLWIEAEDYYARLHTTHGHYLQRLSLTSLELRLDPRHFLRVHRRAILNLNEVRQVRDGEVLEVILSDGTALMVSRARRIEVAAALSRQRARVDDDRPREPAEPVEE